MTDQNSPDQAWQDPIVAEVRQIREGLFAEANYDIREFCRRLSVRQADSGHPVVKRGSLSKEDSSEQVDPRSSEAKAG